MALKQEVDAIVTFLAGCGILCVIVAGATYIAVKASETDHERKTATARTR